MIPLQRNKLKELLVRVHGNLYVNYELRHKNQSLMRLAEIINATSSHQNRLVDHGCGIDKSINDAPKRARFFVKFTISPIFS